MTQQLGINKQTDIAAKTFMATIMNMENLSDKAVINGMITVVYSMLSIAYKNDEERFNATMDNIAVKLKERYKNDYKTNKKGSKESKSLETSKSNGKPKPTKGKDKKQNKKRK